MSAMVYRWKTTAHGLKAADPQTVGLELERLRETDGDGFGTATVVEAAKDEASPLHPIIFDCSVEDAAEQHWQDRARYLLRHLVTVYEDSAHEPRETQAYVSIMDRETEAPRFLPVFTALSDDDYRQQLLIGALAELISFRRKYHEYSEFARVFSAIAAAEKKIRAA